MRLIPSFRARAIAALVTFAVMLEPARVPAQGFDTPVNQFVMPDGRQVELPGMRPLALALVRQTTAGDRR